MSGRVAFLSWVLLAFSLWSSASCAEAPEDALEKRLATLSAELRCLVCQNQSLADSHAELAIDLKNQVKDMMRAGKSDVGRDQSGLGGIGSVGRLRHFAKLRVEGSVEVNGHRTGLARVVNAMPGRGATVYRQIGRAGVPVITEKTPKPNKARHLSGNPLPICPGFGYGPFAGPSRSVC